MGIELQNQSAAWRSHFGRFLQVEQRIVFIGALVWILLAVLRPEAPLLFIALCVVVIGNLMHFLQASADRLYANRPFPWNWIVFLLVLAVASVIAAVVAVAMLRWMVHTPRRQSYETIFRESFPIIMVFSMGAGIAGYAVLEIQRKLQAKNRVLEQEVERSTVALNAQEQEMQRAREIQAGLLPKELPQHARLELAGEWQPARAVGGDYFDVVQLEEDRFGICIGDVAGKGLTASLLMANLQAAFRAYATPDASPAAVCAKLNAFVCGNVAPGKFITFFYAIFDARQRTLLYENAGHCPALLLHAKQAPESLHGNGGVLGVMPEWSYTDSSKQLVEGDRLLLFTDGVTEAENAQAEEFGASRIAQASGTAGTAGETKRRVFEEVSRFCGGDFRDDVTIVVAAIR